MTPKVKRWFCCCCIVGVLCAPTFGVGPVRMFWVGPGGEGLPALDGPGTTTIYAGQGDTVCVEVWMEGIGADFNSSAAMGTADDGAACSGGGSIDADCTTVAVNTGSDNCAGGGGAPGYFSLNTTATNNCGALGTGDQWAWLRAYADPAHYAIIADDGCYTAEVCYVVSGDCCGSAVITWIGTPEFNTAIADELQNIVMNAIFSNLVIVVGGGSDDCPDAQVIGNGVYGYGITCSTTDGPAHPGCTLDNDVWFEFTPSFDGQMRIEVTGGAGYAVYGAGIGCLPGDGDQVLCDETGAFDDSLTVSSGQVFLVRVGTPGGSPAAGNLEINVVPCTPGLPAGDATTVTECGPPATPDDNPCLMWYCDTTGGCTGVSTDPGDPGNTTDGDVCDDGDNCTVNDQCQSGTCEGTRVPLCGDPIEGDRVYRQSVWSGYYFRPYPGYRDYDDLHLEYGGALAGYRLEVFGSTVAGSDAGSPFDVITGLWEDSEGNPTLESVPTAPIPGTECTFIQVPTGFSTLTCEPASGDTIIPDALWLALEFSTDNSGWSIGGGLGEIGYTEDWFAEEELATGELSFYWFGGCPICSAMVAEIGVLPVSCCLPDGTCADEQTYSACAAQNGTPLPPGTTCQGDGDGNGIDDACEGVIWPGSDCWRTACGGTQFDFYANPIPADFFGPGSEPFDGIVLLGGSGEGDFDTSVSRLEPLVLPDVDSSDAIEIELVELSLKSCEPIVVQTDGPPVEWNVRVDLSPTDPPPGTMTVTKTHENGGTFSAEFFVQPVFTFTRVDDANDVRTLDPGAGGIPPTLFKTAGSAPWVHRLSDGSTVFVCGQNFAPGVEEDPVTLEQCCRKVGHSAGPGYPSGHIHETAPPNCSSCPKGACCDPADGSCEVVQTIDNCTGEYKGDGTDCTDTDGDGIADKLETNNCGGSGTRDRCNTGTDPNNPDTDGDGCLDGDEMTAGTDPCDLCDPIDPCTPPPVEMDCNENGRFDQCDIELGTSPDSNGNGIPDECDPGACCYTWDEYYMCVDTTQTGCQEDWGAYDSVFLGIDTQCPTAGASTATHQGTVVIHVTDPAQDCGAGGLRRNECTPGCPIDPWMTTPDAIMCHQFDVGPESPPIPADFFGPGSDPYSGAVCLEGEPLGPTPYGDFGEADTLVRRCADPFDRCDLASPTPSVVEAEVVELSLKSTAAITVTYNGGQNPEQWDVTVDLSDPTGCGVTPPPGTITAVKTHCNGGTYASELHVQPRFTFTKVGDPAEVRVLDTGCEGIPHVTLTQSGGAPWTSDVDETLGLPSDICTDFHPGIEDTEVTSDCDCNANSVRDKCDLETTSPDCNANDVPDECDVAGGGSSDCNGNGVPDECESDCNGNGVPDDCDIDPADPDGNGLVSADCNSNGIPDECEPDCNNNGVADSCDIGTTSQDCNANGVPDECEPDCDGNGQPDGCDIANDPSLDNNNNGILDECERVVCLFHYECFDLDVCTFDQCTGNFCSNTAATYGDVDGNGTISIFDLFCILNGFGGDFSNCSFQADDIAGSSMPLHCNGDGTISVFDLFAVLNAFGGVDPCCGGLP